MDLLVYFIYLPVSGLCCGVQDLPAAPGLYLRCTGLVVPWYMGS